MDLIYDFICLCQPGLLHVLVCHNIKFKLNDIIMKYLYGNFWPGENSDGRNPSGIFQIKFYIGIPDFSFG
jgi:hypothetical protein